MSRTKGHTGKENIKKAVKMSSKKNLRAADRAIVAKVLSGVTDWDEALWLYRPRQCVCYWDFY